MRNAFAPRSGVQDTPSGVSEPIGKMDTPVPVRSRALIKSSRSLRTELDCCHSSIFCTGKVWIIDSPANLIEILFFADIVQAYRFFVYKGVIFRVHHMQLFIVQKHCEPADGYREFLHRQKRNLPNHWIGARPVSLRYSSIAPIDCWGSAG